MDFIFIQQNTTILLYREKFTVPWEDSLPKIRRKTLFLFPSKGGKRMESGNVFPPFNPIKQNFYRMETLNKQIFLVIFLLGWTGLAYGAEISGEDSSSTEKESLNASHFFLFTDLSQAMKLAGELQCPILVHFYSPSCGPCQRMEKQVFSSTEIQETAQKYYLSVKLDGWKAPETVEKFYVKGYPSDYILTHEGKVISRLVGFHPIETYRRFLTETASRMQFSPLSTQQTEQILAHCAQPSAFHPVAISRDTTPIPDKETPSPEKEEMFLPGFAETEAPALPSPRKPLPEAEKNVFMLEGYCPVTLVEEKRWTKGDKQWGVWHEAGLYLFATQKAMEKFYLNPSNYAVMAHGTDIVPLVDSQQVVPGSRKYGARYDGRNFLFANEKNREKFRQDPEKYLSQAQKAWIQTARQPQGTSR